MAAGADFNKTVDFGICADSRAIPDSDRTEQACVRANLHEVAKDWVALLDPDAQAAKGAGIDDAARTDNPGLAGGEAAVGMFQEIGIPNLCFGVEICLVVAAAKFRNCARQKRHGGSVEIGVVLNGPGSSEQIANIVVEEHSPTGIGADNQLHLIVKSECQIESI